MRAIRRAAVRRRGYALLAVLWVLSFASELAASMRLSARDALLAIENRIRLSREAWLAEGCGELARAAIDDALQSESTAASAWFALDSVVAASPITSGCNLEMRPSGTRLSIGADSIRLRWLLLDTGIEAASADSLVAAILDWQDADSIPRPFGAEADWYAGVHRPAPRNAPFGSVAELSLVRGFEEAPGLDTMFTLDPKRILLDKAPLVMVSMLPGVGSEALKLIAQQRAAGERIGDLAILARMLSPGARDTLLAHYAELVAETTPTPEVWTLMSRAGVKGFGRVATLELDLVQSGAAAVVVDRRTDW